MTLFGTPKLTACLLATPALNCHSIAAMGNTLSEEQGLDAVSTTMSKTFVSSLNSYSTKTV